MRVWATIKQFRAEVASLPRERLEHWAKRNAGDPSKVYKGKSANSTLLLNVQAVLDAMNERKV